MKKLFFLIVEIVYSTILFGQNLEQKLYNTQQLQGIWKVYFNYTYPNPGDDSSYTIYHIFKGRKCLDIDVSGSPYDKLSVVVSDFGFSNSYNKNTICAMQLLNDSGRCYVELDERLGLKDCNINVAIIFDVKPKSYLNIFNDECSYLTKVPKKVIAVLYKRGKHDNRDYLKEFLDKTYKEIKVSKAKIYSSPSVSTQMYLIKNDVVEILEEKGDWLRINYYPEKDGKETGKTIEGWIKKSDVE